MAKANKNDQVQQLNLSLGAGLLTIGLGRGWLAGLSLSPVISVVITSVVAAASAIIAVLGGVKEEETTEKLLEQPLLEEESELSKYPLSNASANF